MSVQIKRLVLSGLEFVPISADEAVVVNATNIGMSYLGITTLDKVLTQIAALIGQTATSSELTTAINNLNQLMLLKQDKLTAGYGITIEDDGEIHLSNKFELYKVIMSLPEPGEEHLNVIYLVPSSVQGSHADSLNIFKEYICIKNEDDTYRWEKLGEIQSDVDLSGYVTNTLFNLLSAEAVKTKIIYQYQEETPTEYVAEVSYDIPANLYQRPQY